MHALLKLLAKSSFNIQQTLHFIINIQISQVAQYYRSSKQENYHYRQGGSVLKKPFINKSLTNPADSSWLAYLLTRTELCLVWPFYSTRITECYKMKTPQSLPTSEYAEKGSLLRKGKCFKYIFKLNYWPFLKDNPFLTL